MADLSEETAHRLNNNLDRLAEKISSMGSGIGRGSTSPLPGKNKAADIPVEKLKEMKDRLAALNAELTFSKTLSKAERAERIKLQKSLGTLNDGVQNSADKFDDLSYSLLGFGKNLLRANKDTKEIGDAFGSLGSGLSRNSDKTVKMLGGFANGIGFMIGALSAFADDARKFGGFADLGAFKVGSISQAKIMSGIGDSFIKVIEDSQGGFKAFGRNSQESMENLSELSRGFKVGSSVLGSSLTKNLGPDLTKTMDRAQKSTAEMGLTQEEQAAVMGSLSSTIALTARSEKEAQQMMVKQYDQTVASVRTLSDTFGVSAKEMLKAANEFRKSVGGKALALQGIQGGENIAALIKQMGVGVDDETAARMASSILRGDEGQARLMITNPGAQQQMDAVMGAVRTASSMEGGIGNAKNIQSGARGQIDFLNSVFESRKGFESQKDLFDPAVAGAESARRMKLQIAAEAGDKKAAAELAKLGTTTESGNISAMNNLTDALNLLRGTLIALTAGVVGLVGILPAILGAGGIGGLLSGGSIGKIGNVLGGIGSSIGGWVSKLPGAGKVGGWASGAADKAGGWFNKMAAKGAGSGAAGSGVVDKLSGAAGKGLEGFGEMLGKLGDTKTMKGAATIALLGAALMTAAVGFKTFNEVNWESMVKGTVALAGLAGFAKLLSKFSVDVLMGAASIAALGAALWVAGKGFQAFNGVDWESMGKAAVGLGLLGAAVFGLGAIMMSGAGAVMFGAGLIALVALGATAAVLGVTLGTASLGMTPFARSLGALAEVDGGALIKIGAGLGAIGAGMLVFAAGMVVGTGASILTGIMSIFGAKSPLERIKEFVPIADKIGILGEGIKNFGDGILTLGRGVEAIDFAKLEQLKDAMASFAESGSVLSLPGPGSFGENATTAPGSMDSVGANNMPEPAFTQEGVSVLMGYLSSMQNDIAAIRGNTKQESSGGNPIRMS